MRISRFLLPFLVSAPVCSAVKERVRRAQQVPVSYDSSGFFERISTFLICSQIDPTCDTDTTTNAEIVAVSSDNLKLIYTDSSDNSVGFVGIVDPATPVALGRYNLDDRTRPTSVDVIGPYALVTVDTSDSISNPSGSVLVLDVDAMSLVSEIHLGGQPDSVDISPDGKYAVVAVENRRDGGPLPQAPPGFVVVIDLTGSPSDWSTTRIDVEGLPGLRFPTDPEPEFVSINSDNIAIVVLQENNALVEIDLQSKTVIDSYTAGTVTLTQVDNTEDRVINQTETIVDIRREPDGVVWIDNRYYATGDEGDLDGGPRTFTIWDSTTNEVAYNSGNLLEHIAARYGHYPETRSDFKGTEPENVAFGKYGNNEYLFVMTERASLIYVFDVADRLQPVFIQALPSGLWPEGGLTIPERGLFVAATEADFRNEGFRATLGIYALDALAPQYPTIASVDRVPGVPIPWGALSALAAETRGLGGRDYIAKLTKSPKMSSDDGKGKGKSSKNGASDDDGKGKGKGSKSNSDEQDSKSAKSSSRRILKSSSTSSNTDTHTDTNIHAVTDVYTDAETDANAKSKGKGMIKSKGKGMIKSKGKGEGEGMAKSKGKGVSKSKGKGEGEGMAKSKGKGKGVSKSKGKGVSKSKGKGNNDDKDDDKDDDENNDEDNGEDNDEDNDAGKGKGKGTSKSKGKGTSKSKGKGTSKSKGKGTSKSKGKGTSSASSTSSDGADSKGSKSSKSSSDGESDGKGKGKGSDSKSTGTSKSSKSGSGEGKGKGKGKGSTSRDSGSGKESKSTKMSRKDRPSGGKILYSVEDGFYRKNRIFVIDTSFSPARLIREIRVVDTLDVLKNVPTYGGFSHDDRDALVNDDDTVNLDLEGIAISRTDNGFWLASEGEGTAEDDGNPVESLNMLLEVSETGVIEDVIFLPDEVNDIQDNDGFSGVAQGTGSYASKVVVTFERQWVHEDNPRLGIYNVDSETWEFMFYPVDAVESQNGGWVGVTDIAPIGGAEFLILERDNQGGPDAAIKRIYRVDLSMHSPGETVSKTLVQDLMPALQSVAPGLIYEKIDGLALDGHNNMWIVNDNDGLDADSGETRLLNLGEP